MFTISWQGGMTAGAVTFGKQTEFTVRRFLVSFCSSRIEGGEREELGTYDKPPHQYSVAQQAQLRRHSAVRRHSR